MSKKEFLARLLAFRGALPRLRGLGKQFPLLPTASQARHAPSFAICYLLFSERQPHPNTRPLANYRDHLKPRAHVFRPGLHIG